MHNEDKILLNEIVKRNIKIYETLFFNYYPQLVRFAEGYLFDKQACEDIVQTVFIYFWENAERINITFSLKAYFFESVKNHCLNNLRDIQIHDRHNFLYLEMLMKHENYEELEDSDIISHINSAIAQLPEQMAKIFKLKYLENKKIHEIAQISHITENTVKTQLLRAKGKLRMLLIETTSISFIL